MADHRAENILVAVLDKLSTLTTTGDNTFRGRVYEIPDGELPAVCVYMGTDNPRSDSGSSGWWYIDSDLTLNIEAVAKTSSLQIDTVLNQIRFEVAQALQADITQGLSYVINTTEGTASPEIDGVGEMVTGRLRMEFTILYRRVRYTVPQLSGISVATNGTSVTFHISENVSGTTAGFSITVDGDAVALSGGFISGNDVSFTAASTIYPGDVVLGSYDAGPGDIQGETSPLASFTSQPVDNNSTQSLGYMLNDDGTNAAAFGYVLLPTIAPARLRATHTLTDTSQTLVATPASLTEAPGLVTLVEGVPLVCGFMIHSVPASGAINGFTFQLYNVGGSGSVLVHASVNKDTDATTGTIRGASGTFPPSVANFGIAFAGELIGAKVSIQLTLASGELSGRLFVNGTLIGTSTPIATDGGVVAVLNVSDGEGTGVLDISCVPDAASLATGYGTFDTGAVDMVGAVI